MTTAQRDAIASPATGLQIYNTDTSTPEAYNGTSWVSMGGGSPAGSTTEIQFNNAGSFSSDPNLVWNPGAGGLQVLGTYNIYSINGPTTTFIGTNPSTSILFGSENLNLISNGSVSNQTWIFDTNGDITLPGNDKKIIFGGNDPLAAWVKFDSYSGGFLFSSHADGNAYLESAAELILYANALGSALPAIDLRSTSGGEDVIITSPKGVSIANGFNATPDASSMLDIQSTTKGFLPPRMTTAQRETIVTRAEGTATVVDYNALTGAVLTINGITLTEGVDWFDRPLWATDIATPLVGLSTWSVNTTNAPVGIVNNNTLADNLSNLSISFWVKIAGNGASHTFKKCAGNAGFTPDGTPGWIMHFVNGTPYFDIVQDGSNYVQLILNSGIADGNWHNVIITYDQSITTIVAYVDGILDTAISSMTGTVTTYASTDPVTFYGGDNPFFGQSFFDEARIFSTILSQADATAIAAGGDPTGATELAHWTVEEGTGAILNDSVGSNTMVFGSNQNTADQLVSAINMVSGTALVSAADNATTTITITANVPGPSGNSITLATSDGANLPVSGAALAGGSASVLPEGLIIYNTDTHQLQGWDGTNWQNAW
jgi:hypothetical protein